MDGASQVDDNGDEEIGAIEENDMGAIESRISNATGKEGVSQVGVKLKKREMKEIENGKGANNRF